jgi:NADPH:quinone reductase-like Zn-dependent oxidoreductase
MRALRFNEFGDPGVLHVTDLPDPAATAQEAVIRVDSASVNPSDVKNVAGQMESTILPRIPGRDFAGVVISGPPEWEGAAVWGTGGDVDEKLAYRFTRQLSNSHHVDDATFADTRKAFGDRGIVDMTLLAGAYHSVCGLLNAFEVPAPAAPERRPS